MEAERVHADLQARNEFRIITQYKINLVLLNNSIY